MTGGSTRYLYGGETGLMPLCWRIHASIEENKPNGKTVFLQFLRICHVLFGTGLFDRRWRNLAKT